ncbi:MAG TPA: methionyl-tRNA formyltransferase [Methylibium sp.]|uniref:methionyl-tRNA formyltransferase n=1 Tax=Methylibium sp. TaxID=2067992 RepID=UPI002DBA5048|nr:methionyl-tRNA formyltransferase [Methylibium sp.]HEU4458723.1 methionyl-tRNA formyltransferase [Methylibium sp.]
MRLAFAGTPEFARVALEHLLDAGFELPLVLTQPDRPAGRGMKLQASPVKQLAQQRGLAVVQPKSLKLDGAHRADAEAARAALSDARIDALIVAAYGLLLPAWTLALPPLGGLNIHASLLPRWRGAAPIHRAIEAGDTQTGICIMQMDEGLDTGPVLAARAEPIRADDTTASLHDRLAPLGARLVVEVLRRFDGGAAPPPQGQPDDGVSYARKIEKHEARFDWRASAEAIERRVRAFDPFPGASFEWRGETLKLWRAEVVEASGVPGQVIAGGAEPVVACGRGALKLLQVQRAGGRRIAARELFESYPPSVGAPLAVP